MRRGAPRATASGTPTGAPSGEPPQHPSSRDDREHRDAFHRAVEEARRDGDASAVLLLDIDDFRDVNDTLGHRAGDGLLTVTAHRLRDLAEGTVARRALAEVGVQLSIDDFGTGYSSLAYLDRLPVHEVKIDQSFAFRLERQAGDATIVWATVALAHELGMRVVAEGVESELATRLVAELGCDLFQGYGLARPMPPEEVLGWLDRRAAHPRGSRPGAAVVRSRAGGRLTAVAQPADEGPSGPLPAQLQA